MEIYTALKAPRRIWKTLALVFSPMGLALFWCAFIDRESFGAFVFGVLFTILFGTIALGAWLTKKAAAKQGKELHDV